MNIPSLRIVRAMRSRFPSIKMGRMIRCYSILERHYCLRLEFDSDVIAYRSHCCRIHYFLDKKRKYYADFLVYRRGAKQIVEVKQAQKAATEKIRQKSSAVSEVCAKNGFEYVVMTSDDIDQQPDLDNLYLIFKYARIPITNAHLIACEKFFTNDSPHTLGLLESQFENWGIWPATPIIFSLIFWGIVQIDVYSIISAEAPIFLASTSEGVKSNDAKSILP